jgi:Flp pilus assembly protein TadD
LRRQLAQALRDAVDPAEAARFIAPLARSMSATSGDALLLSIALREAGEPTGAAQTARALLQRWRPTPAAHNALGDALLDLGQNAEAAQAYRDSLVLDPDQPEIRAKLERISG